MADRGPCALRLVKTHAARSDDVLQEIKCSAQPTNASIAHHRPAYIPPLETYVPDTYANYWLSSAWVR